MTRTWNYRRHHDWRKVRKRMKQVDHWDMQFLWPGWTNHGPFGGLRKRQLANGRGTGNYNAAYDRHVVISGRKGKWERKKGTR